VAAAIAAETRLCAAAFAATFAASSSAPACYVQAAASARLMRSGSTCRKPRNHRQLQCTVAILQSCAASSSAPACRVQAASSARLMRLGSTCATTLKSYCLNNYQRVTCTGCADGYGLKLDCKAFQDSWSGGQAYAVRLPAEDVDSAPFGQVVALNAAIDPPVHVLPRWQGLPKPVSISACLSAWDQLHSQTCFPSRSGTAPAPGCPGCAVR